MKHGPQSNAWLAVHFTWLGLLAVALPACNEPPADPTADVLSNEPAAETTIQGSHSAGDTAVMQNLNSNSGNRANPSDEEMASFDRQATHGELDENAEEAATEPAYYSVAHYDTEADPAVQLTATLERASQEKKTVLLQVGGDWCVWCKRMTSFIAENPVVNDLVSRNYVIQKVTYDADNPNDTFLSQYPKISGYPHLFVLDAEGSLLHSQDTAELEEGQSYSQEAFVGFLEKWKPAQAN